MEKAYKTYKYSGIEWIGEIPESWDTSTLKYYSNIITGNTPSTKVESYFSEKDGIPWVKPNNLDGLNKITNSETYLTEEGLKEARIVKKGSVLVGGIGNIGKLGVAGKDLTTNQQIHAIEFNRNFDDSYGKYVMLMSKTELESNSSSVVVSILNKSELASLKIPVPSLKEQTQIAIYLDYHISKIDKLITKKEILIQKLQEHRQAIINEAVTKGLDSNVELKDSGVDWLGKIPEHWEVIKLFGLCYLVRGNTSFKKNELLSSGKYIALQYGKTYKVNVVDEKYKFYVNDEFYKDSQVVNYGDTIIISTSETIEDLGHSVFYKRNDLGLLGGEQILLKTKSDKINPKYLFYSTTIFSKDIRKNATGVKVFRINVSDLKNVFVSVPPINEQDSIVSYIETKSKTIDNIILHTQTSIQKFKAYRQSLISEAVTGKVDVRNWEKPKNN